MARAGGGGMSMGGGMASMGGGMASMGGGGGGGASDIPAPAGWPGDLPGPEPLAGATAKDAEPLEELAGEYCARAFFSKNWQLRDAALNYLSAQIRDQVGTWVGSTARGGRCVGLGDGFG